MECVICGRDADRHGIVLMTLCVNQAERVTACPDHLRQAIALTDVKPLTDEEWRALAGGVLDAFADIEDAKS